MAQPFCSHFGDGESETSFASYLLAVAMPARKICVQCKAAVYTCKAEDVWRMHGCRLYACVCRTVCTCIMCTCTCVIHTCMLPCCPQLCQHTGVSVYACIMPRMREVWVWVPPECSCCFRYCVVLCCVALSFFLSFSLSECLGNYATKCVWTFYQSSVYVCSP